MKQKALHSALSVLRPALQLADPNWLTSLRLRLLPVAAGVGRRDAGVVFDWFLTAFQYQGMSDAVTTGYIEEHGLPGWDAIGPTLDRPPECARLGSHWQFEGCGYRKDAWTCAEPALLAGCPLPRHPFRNGRLSQAAYSLFLFVRDVCDGDLVGWIDTRLAAADRPSDPERARLMRQSLLEPMGNIFGVSNKVLSMALADFLLAADPTRERWVTTGAGLIAIDTLVHNFLHRTGILHSVRADHLYGSDCYGPNGCAGVVERLAREIDARAFNPEHPAVFPRFVQHAIWHFCAGGELNICNGNRIDDAKRCANRSCPAYAECPRIALNRG